jgi:hypothetical protein
MLTGQLPGTGPALTEQLGVFVLWPVAAANNITRTQSGLTKQNTLFVMRFLPLNSPEPFGRRAANLPRGWPVPTRAPVFLRKPNKREKFVDVHGLEVIK